MTIEFVGKWRDLNEKRLVRHALMPLVRSNDVWIVSLINGKEKILTHNPAHPLEIAAGRALLTLSPAEMRQPPRYALRHGDLDWVAFSAPTIPVLMLAVQLYYTVGVDKIKEMVVTHAELERVTTA